MTKTWAYEIWAGEEAPSWLLFTQPCLSSSRFVTIFNAVLDAKHGCPPWNSVVWILFLRVNAFLQFYCFLTLFKRYVPPLHRRSLTLSTTCRLRCSICVPVSISVTEVDLIGVINAGSQLLRGHSTKRRLVSNLLCSSLIKRIARCLKKSSSLVHIVHHFTASDSLLDSHSKTKQVKIPTVLMDCCKKNLIMKR